MNSTPARFRILITDDISPAGLALLQEAPDISVDIVKRPDHARLLELIGGYDALVTRSATPLDAETFGAAPRLKVAGRAGVGLDNVDVDAATGSGVVRAKVWVKGEAEPEKWSIEAPHKIAHRKLTVDQ